MDSANWFDISRQSRRRYRFPMPQNGDAIMEPVGPSATAAAGILPLLLSLVSATMRQSDQSPLGTDLQTSLTSKAVFLMYHFSCLLD